MRILIYEIATVSNASVTSVDEALSHVCVKSPSINCSKICNESKKCNKLGHSNSLFLLDVCLNKCRNKPFVSSVRCLVFLFTIILLRFSIF